MKYKAICFDIDGTLYSTDLLQSNLLKVARPYPCFALKYSAMRNRFREVQEDFSKYGLQNLSFEEKEASILAEVSKGKYSVDRAARLLRKRYYNRLEKVYRKLSYQAEVVETFKNLKSREISIGVLSDWPLMDKLEKIGVANLVDFVTCANEIGFLKPDKRCFEFLLNKMGFKPEEVLYVGDSYKKDIIGAAGAGIDSVLINCKKPDSVSYPKACKVFRNWREFDAWIKEA